MKKIFFLLFLFLTIGGGVLAMQDRTEPQQQQKIVTQEKSGEKVQSAVSTSRLAIPKRLVIPKIGVDAASESVGLDAKGNMDVPKYDENVAWYNLGYKLGEPGNTVLAGHFDTRTGTPAVFYKLETLRAGDEIIVEGDNGEEYRYIVSRVVTYPFNQFPLEEVFGSHSTNRLNLITCEGSYNSTTRNYSHRTVVYSELSQ